MCVAIMLQWSWGRGTINMSVSHGQPFRHASFRFGFAYNNIYVGVAKRS
jgi:hypothetical protein